MEPRNRRRSLFWPVLLIAVGVIMLLNTLGRFEGATWETLWRLWPLLFIVGGLDSLYRQEGFVWAVVSIGVGTLFLLGNLGYLSIGSFWELARYWPVLLIAFGLDLIIARRGLWSALVGVALGLLLIAGIFWMTVGAGAVVLGRQAQEGSQPISQPLKDASRGDITLTVIGGNLSVHSGAPANTLISGQISQDSRQRVSESYEVMEGVGRYKLESQGMGMFMPIGSGANDWNLRLASRLPLDLHTEVIFGEQQVELGSMQVKNLNAETVFGRVVVTAPKEGELNAKASVVFGQMVIRVPAGTAVRIKTGGGLGSTSVPDDFRREGDFYYSPKVNGAADVMEIEASTAIGSLTVETIP